MRKEGALRYLLSNCLGHRIFNSLILKAHEGMLALLPDLHGCLSFDEVHDKSLFVQLLFSDDLFSGNPRIPTMMFRGSPCVAMLSLRFTIR